MATVTVSYLGVATAGFPNMFMVLGANSCFANIPPVIEAQVDFISDLISRAQRSGAAVEAPQEAEIAVDDAVLVDAEQSP
jgi:cyclohexanone monooxygenase